MFSQRTNSNFPLAVIELLARIGSVASVTFLVMLFVGEGFHPSEISKNEWVGLVFFPIGVVIGMVIAWWKEGTGSAITLGSLLGFYLVWGYFLQNHIGGWWFLAFASPAFLFLLHWFLVGARESHPVV